MSMSIWSGKMYRACTSVSEERNGERQSVRLLGNNTAKNLFCDDDDDEF